MNLDEVVMIISHRCDPDHQNDLRTRSLSTILGFYSKFLPELKICVVEQDHKPSGIQRLFTNPNHSHFFIQNSGLFNRSWAHNIGYKLNVDKKYFIFSDNDVVVSIDSLQEMLSNVDKYKLDAVAPKYRRESGYGYYQYDLTEESTIDFISNNSFADLVYKKRNTTFSGGFVVFTNYGLQKIRGWDERCVGWGGEDNIMDIKIRKLLKNGVMKCPLYHLNHNKSREDETEQHEFYRDNAKLIKQYMENFDESLSKSLSIDNLFSFKFLTFLNFGCLDICKNMIESARRVGIPSSEFIVYCLDDESYSNLKDIVHCVRFTTTISNSYKNWSSNPDSEFRKVVNNKWKIIKEAYTKYKNLCWVDTDIVFLKDFRFLSNQFDGLLCQSDLPASLLCSGFMIFSNNSQNEQLINDCANAPGGDQLLLNSFYEKYSNNIKCLSLELFPNGHVYYQQNIKNKDAYMVHNNHMIGIDTKIQHFKDEGLWFI